jgi:DNA mismatch repair protein MutL
MGIHLLPTEVVDQIAAGEVVERPAHLVKELVENSLDAGADHITVEYSEGGRYVKVVDNGSGIDPADLPKALQRFATSKIEKAADLWRLNSFGFRGEALASIASVSRLTLISRRAGAETGSRLIADFGKMGPIENVGGSFGTTLVVEDLFSNVPARLKFLKTAAAEGSQIKTVMKALALAYPQVAIVGPFRRSVQGCLYPHTRRTHPCHTDRG